MHNWRIEKIILQNVKDSHANGLPVTTTLEAPNALAVSKVTNPIGPAPNTNTIEPIPTPPRLQAWTPTDKGSSRAPSSRVTWSGNLKYN